MKNGLSADREILKCKNCAYYSERTEKSGGCARNPPTFDYARYNKCMELYRENIEAGVENILKEPDPCEPEWYSSPEVYGENFCGEFKKAKIEYKNGMQRIIKAWMGDFFMVKS